MKGECSGGHKRSNQLLLLNLDPREGPTFIPLFNPKGVFVFPSTLIFLYCGQNIWETGGRGEGSMVYMVPNIKLSIKI